MVPTVARPSAHTRAHTFSEPQLPAFPSSSVEDSSTPENWDEDFDFEHNVEPTRRPSVRRRRGISVPADIYRLQGNVIEDLGHMHSFVTIIEDLKNLREARDSLAHQLRNPGSPAAHAILQSTRNDWERAEVMIEIASDPESASVSPAMEPESEILLPPPDRQADILRDIISTTNSYSFERRWSSSTSTGSMCPSLSSSSSASSACELDLEDDELIFSTPSSPINESCPAWDNSMSYGFDEKKIRFGADTLPGLVRYVSELQGRLRRGLVELKSLTV